MRITLRFLPITIFFAGCTGIVTSSSGCGPRELFLGAFAGNDAAPQQNDDVAVSDAAALDVGLQSVACDPGWLADASPIRAFESEDCRSCALSTCCSAVTGCFGTVSGCASYAQCIDQCWGAAEMADASPSPNPTSDASSISAPPDCEATCSYLTRPDAYSVLATCLANACACPHF